MQIDLRKNMALKYSKIIVGGCSVTDKNYPKTARPNSLDFKMWPEIIGDKLNCEVINTAKCGFGNQAIFHETLKAVWENIDDIEHVYVMWSEWARQDFLRKSSGDNNKWYEMEKINGIPLSKIFLSEELTENKLNHIFGSLERIHNCEKEIIDGRRKKNGLEKNFLDWLYLVLWWSIYNLWVDLYEW